MLSYQLRRAFVNPRQVSQVLSSTSPLPSLQVDSRGPSRAFSLSVQQNLLTESYAQGLSKVPLSGNTIGSQLRETVEKYPDREALVFCETNQRRTFEHFWLEIEKFAAGLMKVGFKKGDLLGIWGCSSLEWTITQFATSLIGVILVNVNPAYQVDEVEYALQKVGCKGVVASTPFKTQDYYGMLRSICPELDTCGPGRLESKRLPGFDTVIMMGDEQLPGTFRFNDIMDMATPQLVGEAANVLDSLCFDDAINIQFTSGTTGRPKGATLTHHNVVNNSLLVGDVIGYKEEEVRICCQVPLYHCFGMVAGLLCGSAYGVGNIFPSAGYDPVATLKCLEEENVTMLYGTPTMFVDACALVEAKGVQLPNLKRGVIAGSPVPPELLKKTEEVLGIHLHIAYGSTETSPVVCLTSRDDPYEQRITTVGRTTPQTENMVADSDGKPVPIGESGEILSRGYCVMLKYWNDEEKTAAAITKNNWYHSGDLGVMDEHGFIKVTGRLKDMIIRGGENIYPAEIENFLHKHPKIDDVQVVGIPDDRLGEELGAWIRLSDGENLTAEEIKEFCQGKLAHFKIPKYIKFVDAYPLTVTRKVQKFKIRELYTKELGLGKQ